MAIHVDIRRLPVKSGGLELSGRIHNIPEVEKVS